MADKKLIPRIGAGLAAIALAGSMGCATRGPTQTAPLTAQSVSCTDGEKTIFRDSLVFAYGKEGVTLWNGTDPKTSAMVLWDKPNLYEKTVTLFGTSMKEAAKPQIERAYAEGLPIQVEAVCHKGDWRGIRAGVPEGKDSPEVFWYNF